MPLGPRPRSPRPGSPPATCALPGPPDRHGHALIADEQGLLHFLFRLERVRLSPFTGRLETAAREVLQEASGDRIVPVSRVVDMAGVDAGRVVVLRRNAPMGRRS